jgi:pilus assembly protein CpaE
MTPSEIKALVAHDAGIAGGWVADHMPVGSGIAVVGIVGDLTPTPDEVQVSDADVLVVASAEQPEAALALVEWWAVNRPARPVVVLCHASPNGFVGRAFSAGADDLIVVEPGRQVSSEVSGELVFALQKALARRSTPAENGSGLGAMICVLGPKGGIGKTLTCCNLGISLVELAKRVVLVDLDLQFGDLALSLGLTPQNTMHDLATAGGSLDVGKIESYLATHSSGMRVLMAPTRPDQASSIKIDFLRDVFAVLRSTYDYVILDTPPGFTPEVIASIDASSHVCMVGMLDALSLKNTKLGLETLELMGYEAQRVRLVLNRADSSVGITHNDVLSILGRPPDVLVPSHRDITRSVNEGTPIILSHRRSEAAKAFRALAGLYASAGTGAAGKPPKRSLLARSLV